MEKTISITSLVVAIAAGAVAVTKPDVKSHVSATAGEDDVAVTEVVKAAGVTPVECCRGWYNTDKLGWLCSDSGFNPGRQAWLEKKAGAHGKPVRCISFDPSEVEGGNVAVKVTIHEGETPEQPKPPVVEEPKGAEAEAIGG